MPLYCVRWISVLQRSAPDWSCHLRVRSRAFDENLRALREEFLDDLAEALAEDHDAVPFGPLLAFTARSFQPG